MGLKREYVILRDTREKKPLIFPETLVMLDDTKPPWFRRSITVRLRVEDYPLKTGDYCLLGYEKVCLVERKGSLREVAGYCITKDGCRRFTSQVERLKEEAALPYLLMEGTPIDLLRPTLHVEKPGQAMDSFQRFLLKNEIPLILLPAATTTARKAVGEWVARLMINGALTHGMDDHE
jgi:ERCC4-type nuclease